MNIIIISDIEVYRAPEDYKSICSALMHNQVPSCCDRRCCVFHSILVYSYVICDSDI